MIRGSSCPGLSEAARHARVDDRVALARSVEVAAAAAERSLDRSGDLFGSPELVALELRVAVAERVPAAQISQLLARAERSCRRLGRWRA